MSPGVMHLQLVVGAPFYRGTGLYIVCRTERTYASRQLRDAEPRGRIIETAEKGALLSDHGPA